jgi:hypothetical protein
LRCRSEQSSGRFVGDRKQFSLFENGRTYVLYLALIHVPAMHRGDQQVLENGEIVEGLRDLEGPPNAGEAPLHCGHARDVLAFEPHGS